MTPTVTIATVTYGERAPLLAAVLDGIERLAGRDHVVAVIVVDNDATDATKELLAGRDVDVVQLAPNRGSASGFAAAISRAVVSGSDYVWLLDDDNLPEPGSLNALLQAARDLPEGTALQCLRSNYDHLRRLVDGMPPAVVFGHANAFLDASFRHDRLAPPVAGIADDYPAMPWGFYGGLFTPTEALSDAGLPMEELVLYVDDTEYTHRLAAAGGLRLVPKAVVEDLDDPWWMGRDPVDWVAGAGTAAERRRLYYWLRNVVYFQRTRLVTHPIEFTANRWLKSWRELRHCRRAAVAGRTTQPLRNWALYRRAVRHGMRGRLGSCSRVDRAVAP